MVQHGNLLAIQEYVNSRHFLGGNKSEDPRNPAYYPTIFPIEYKRKEPSNINLDRFSC